MVTMTDTAVSHLKEIMQKQAKSDVALRLYVTPGGCSGFSYGMDLDDEAAEDDQTFDYQGVKVVVDPFSLQYLDGAQLDYVDALMGGGFTVQNPNAVKTCSCGQSFDTSTGGGQAKPCS
ncbi:MAG TPA: iron-sulfur cluster insertion protein ErpA [Chloroflexota bacterium]|nr:iron-sulfur cluster insertion protein ErpA [Chloroflexota bacterium]